LVCPVFVPPSSSLLQAARASVAVNAKAAARFNRFAAAGIARDPRFSPESAWAQKGHEGSVERT
jgi:hypothetical protein